MGTFEDLKNPVNFFPNIHTVSHAFFYMHLKDVRGLLQADPWFSKELKTELIMTALKMYLCRRTSLNDLPLL